MEFRVPPSDGEGLVIPVVLRADHINFCVDPRLGGGAGLTDGFSDLLRQGFGKGRSDRACRFWGLGGRGCGSGADISEDGTREGRREGEETVGNKAKRPCGHEMERERVRRDRERGLFLFIPFFFSIILFIFLSFLGGSLSSSGGFGHYPRAIEVLCV